MYQPVFFYISLSPNAPLTAVDDDTDARFVNLMMSLPEKSRKIIGHSFGKYESTIENASRTGFVYSCVFKGGNCSDEM